MLLEGQALPQFRQAPHSDGDAVGALALLLTLGSHSRAVGGFLGLCW